MAVTCSAASLTEAVGPQARKGKSLTGSGIGGTTERASGALSVDGLAASWVAGAAAAGAAAAGAVTSAKTNSMAEQHATVVSGSSSTARAPHSRYQEQAH